MPFCSACKRQYEPHIKSCQTCKIMLVDSIQPEAPLDSASEGYYLAELARFSNVAKAVMVKELLEANAIATV